MNLTKAKRIIKRICFSVVRMTDINDSEKKYKLAIVAIIKNEGLYIDEWIKYHVCIGVDHFFLYDNGSTDNTHTIINHYIESGLITFTDYPGKAMQISAYNDAIRKHGKDCKYMAFIDGDEFIFPMNKEDNIVPLIDKLLKQDSKAGGLAINWREFGSSGYDTTPTQGGVLDNYVNRAPEFELGNACIKTICKPSCVAYWAHVHYPVYVINRYSIDENGDKVSGWSNSIQCKLIRLNHYFTKSKEEWIKRRSLGRADIDNPDPTFERGMDVFHKHDNNEVFDDSIMYYVNKCENIGAYGEKNFE